MNFCTKNIEKLLNPLILFKEVPEVIISKWWGRIYTHESPLYSIMNKSLMKSEQNDNETYIRLLYRGLSYNSYRPVYFSKLKSIFKTDTIISSKCFLSFSVNKKVEKSSTEKDKKVNLKEFKMAIAFQSNCVRKDSSNKPKISNKSQTNEDSGCYIANPPKKRLKNANEKESDDNEEENKSLNILIEISNLSESDKNKFIISNVYLKEISYYSKEEEVLIFPYTGLEVTEWNTYSFLQKKGELKGTIFYFKFSQKFKELINEKYD